jgi:hypothetical protein
MVRRFDQFYRVKPRDNLGDPDYWNRRFDDMDRRISSNEDGIDTVNGLSGYVEGLALNRLNEVLQPALDKISLVSEEGFLLAHSDSTVTLDTTTTQVFVVGDESERKLFTPSPFVTITRAANMTDYAFAQTMAWDRDTGELTLKPLQIFGNAGPFNDWVIYVGTAISMAVQSIYTQAAAARDLAKTYRDTASANAAQTSSDKSAVTDLRNEVLIARDAAAQSASNASLWDPSSYSTTSQMNAAISAAVAALVDGAPATLDTLKELATALGDANFGATVTAALAARLRFDAAQELTATQKQTAQANLGRATAAEIRNNTNAGILTTDQEWAAAGWVNLGNVSGSITIDLDTGFRFYGTLVGNVTVNVTHMKPSQPIDIVFMQDATGSRTVSWSATFKWANNTAPGVTTTANSAAVQASGIGNWDGTLAFMAGWKFA